MLKAVLYLIVHRRVQRFLSFLFFSFGGDGVSRVGGGRGVYMFLTLCLVTSARVNHLKMNNPEVT